MIFEEWKEKDRERQLMRLGMPSLIRVRFEIWRIGLTRRRFILFYFIFFFQIYKSTLCDGRKEEEIPLKILVSSGTEKNPIFLLSFFFFFLYVKWKRWRRTTSRPRNTEEFLLDNEGKKNGHGDDVCVARAQDQRVCRVDLQNESSRKEK